MPAAAETAARDVKGRLSASIDCTLSVGDLLRNFVSSVHADTVVVLLVQSSVDDGDTGIHVKPKYTDEDASTNVNKSAPAYPQPPISSAAARSKRHDNPVVREQEAALESFQKVVQLIGEQRAKVESLERRMELGIVGDGYDNIDDHELVVHQRQIFEMEDSTQAAIDALMNGEGKDARLDAILVGLNGALEVAGEEEARIEGMQEAVDEASDGVARFRGFANEAEYELGKLKDDFAQVGELLTEAIEAVESVLEEGSQPNS